MEDDYIVDRLGEYLWTGIDWPGVSGTLVEIDYLDNHNTKVILETESGHRVKVPIHWIDDPDDSDMSAPKPRPTLRLIQGGKQ